jgi:hypothetical protein
LPGDKVAGDEGSAAPGRGISLGVQDDSHTDTPDGGLAAAFRHTTDGSYAACETAKAARAFYGDLAVVDASLCAFRSALAALGGGALDGKTHGMHMSLDGADHARFRAIRAGSMMADVSVDLCKGGKQVAHARYEMSEASVHLSAKVQKGATLIATTMDAGLNAEGHLSGSKKITTEHHDANGVTLAEGTQTADELVLSRAGGVRLFADAELLDANAPGTRYAFANLALGDGAALIADGAATMRQGWSGDTWEASEAVAQAARVADVQNDELLQAPPGGAAASFAGDETYACDQAEDFILSADFDLDAAQCPDGVLPQGSVDCKAVLLRDRAETR